MITYGEAEFDVERAMISVQKINGGFVMLGEVAATATEAYERLAVRLEAASARLPRSFASVDAMHWTPPADGQGVPPCLA